MVMDTEFWEGFMAGFEDLRRITGPVSRLFALYLYMIGNVGACTMCIMVYWVGCLYQEDEGLRVGVWASGRRVS